MHRQSLITSMYTVIDSQYACVIFHFCILCYFFSTADDLKDTFLKTRVMSHIIMIFNMLISLWYLICISYLGGSWSLCPFKYIHSSWIHFNCTIYILYLLYIYYATLQEISTSSVLFVSTPGERRALSELCEKKHLLKKTYRANSSRLRLGFAEWWNFSQRHMWCYPGSIQISKRWIWRSLDWED